MAMGQAAGSAASLAIISKLSVKDIDINRLRDNLREMGAIVP
jgi:hypothetical protein